MTDPNRKAKNIREIRLPFVAEYRKKGYSLRQIAEKVKVAMGLEKAPSLNMIQRDMEYLLKEWQSNRVADFDQLVTLELERIDDACQHLWEAWEKSKTDFKASSTKQRGTLDKKKKVPGEKEKADADSKIPDINFMEQQKKEVINFGDPRFLTEIRQQLMERRRLLGLYAPVKSEVTGKNGEPLQQSPLLFLSADAFTEDQIQEYITKGIKDQEM